VSQHADEITNPFTVSSSPSYERDGRVAQESTDFPKNVETAC